MARQVKKMQTMIILTFLQLVAAYHGPSPVSCPPRIAQPSIAQRPRRSSTVTTLSSARHRLTSRPRDILPHDRKGLDAGRKNYPQTAERQLAEIRDYSSRMPPKLAPAVEFSGRQPCNPTSRTCLLKSPALLCPPTAKTNIRSTER